VSVITVRTKRVDTYRGTFDAVSLGAADGLFEIAKEIVDVASGLAADSPRPPYPLGEGLPRQGGAVAWVGKKKVNNASNDGSQVAKPRSLVLLERETAQGEAVAATAIAGYGFPARFVELGTVDHPAQPFLTPAAMQVVPGGEAVLSAAMQRRLKGARLKPGQRDAR
jgi:hypothetical protein